MANQGPDARSVIEFLKIDYAEAMSQYRTYYDRSKKDVLALLGGDLNALRACPQVMRDEVYVSKQFFIVTNEYLLVR